VVDRKKIVGWTAGHRVWFANTWDGAVLARRYAEYGVGMVVADEAPDPYGRILVTLGDGTPERIAKDHLRLTPPPGTDSRRVKPKVAKPKVRKEAIDPAFGEELDLLDLEM